MLSGFVLEQMTYVVHVEKDCFGLLRTELQWSASFVSLLDATALLVEQRCLFSTFSIAKSK